MRQLMSISVSAVLCCWLVLVPSVSPSKTNKLVHHLLNDDYNAAVAPDEKVELTLTLAAICVLYEEETGQLTGNFWEYHQWTDSRLSWDPKKFDGIEQLRLPASLVWTPDTRQYNSLVAVEMRDTGINVMLDADGTINWVPRAEYRSFCKPENDSISCLISVGSWTYDQTLLSIAHFGPTKLQHYRPECPYVVVQHVEVKDSSPCVRGIVDNLHVTLTIKRRR